MFDVLGPSGPPGATGARGTTGEVQVQDRKDFVGWIGHQGVRRLPEPPVRVGPRGPLGLRDTIGRLNI